MFIAELPSLFLNLSLFLLDSSWDLGEEEEEEEEEEVVVVVVG